MRICTVANGKGAVLVCVRVWCEVVGERALATWWAVRGGDASHREACMPSCAVQGAGRVRPGNWSAGWYLRHSGDGVKYVVGLSETYLTTAIRPAPHTRTTRRARHDSVHRTPLLYACSGGHATGAWIWMARCGETRRRSWFGAATMRKRRQRVGRASPMDTLHSLRTLTHGCA